MNIWHDIDNDRITKDEFIACIEIPKGSKKKYELDKETGMIILDRILYTSTHYPANYGFIPKTYSEDGDPLDCLILCSESLDPLTLVRCYPIGVIKMLDQGKLDEKINKKNCDLEALNKLIATQNFGFTITENNNPLFDALVKDVKENNTFSVSEDSWEKVKPYVEDPWLILENF